MNRLISKSVSALAAGVLLTGSMAAMPASADLAFAADSSVGFSVGAFTDKQPEVSDSYKSTAKYVKISWEKVTGASGYRVYRKADGKGKYKAVAELSGKNTVTYKDTDVTPGTQYAYKIKAYKGTSSKQYSKSSKAVQTVAAPDKVEEITKVWGKGDIAKLKWGKQDSADGYVVYYNYEGKWKKAAVIDSADTVTARIDLRKLSLSYYDYSLGTQFCVKSYAADAKGGIKTAAASKTDLYCNMEQMSEYYADGLKLLAKVSKGDSKTTFTNENAQPKKSTKSKGSMTANDLKAVKKFAKSHFQSSWSDEQKVLYTLAWINRNNTYDTEYKHIRPGYAESIFEGRWGQCSQYNGALIEVMSYLGYDATLIQGFRGYDVKEGKQHFWGEVKVGSKKYVMETGNFGKNGGWSYFCTSYKYAGGYIKNQKVVTK